MQKSLSKNFGEKTHKRSGPLTGNPSTNGHQTSPASLQQQQRMANINPRNVAANLQLKQQRPTMTWK